MTHWSHSKEYTPVRTCAYVQKRTCLEMFIMLVFAAVTATVGVSITREMDGLNKVGLWLECCVAIKSRERYVC